MPVFTAIAAAATAFGAFLASSTLAAFAARTLLTIGISKLLSNRARSRIGNAGESGSRVQLPPATDNKLPVVYGKAYINPVITDAKLTENQKIMWYVLSLAEVTDTGSYTFGDIYWGGRKCVFGDPYTAKVTALETNSDPVQTDTSVNGWIYIWRFPNGSLSGIDTGGSSAVSLLSDAVSGGGIPANIRWDSALYNSNGQYPWMDKTAFLVVRLEYNVDANTTGLPPVTVELTNSLTRPGQVLYDYMTNQRYGCAIPTTDVDTVSLTSLDNYSDQLVSYYDTNNVLQTQPRYRIDGPILTNNTCLDNLEILVDSCDSWLQYSELTGKWKVVINQSYQQAGQLITDLYQVTDSNLIGGINVNPIDLNNTFNQLEVQYPNKNIRDQTDFKLIKLIDYYPELLSKNEPINGLTVQLPVVNNYIRGVYLGLRRLLQSREDLVIDLFLDYSGIQLEAGDVIRVPFSTYGWESMNSGNGKLFRVSQVQEAKLEDGSLGVKIIAFEYNPTIYVDNLLNDFVPQDNTGLTDPNIISLPGQPIAQLLGNVDITSFSITSAVPEQGSVLYMDFNYGTSNNVDTHLRYRTVSSAGGLGFVNSGDIANNIVNNVSIDINDLPPDTYYFSVTARNDFSGRISIASNSFVWPGATATVANNANTANTVIVNAQPNITSVGNLTTVVVTGTGNIGNLVVNGTSNLGPVGNITITGGSNGQVLTTNGLGGLSWTTVSGGGNISIISNGTSNVSIPVANGNISFSTNNSERMRLTTTGSLVLGYDANTLALSSAKLNVFKDPNVNQQWAIFSDNLYTSVWLYTVGDSTYFGEIFDYQKFTFICNNQAVMTLTPSGNVGIGTTNPNNKFVVNGTGSLSNLIVSSNITAGNITANTKIECNLIVANSMLTVSAYGQEGLEIIPGTSGGTSGVMLQNFNRTSGLYGNMYYDAKNHIFRDQVTEKFRILPTGAISTGISGNNTGNVGQVLTSNGAGHPPTWSDVTATTSNIVNGTSSVSIPVVDGNILLTANNQQMMVINENTVTINAVGGSFYSGLVINANANTTTNELIRFQSANTADERVFFRSFWSNGVAGTTFYMNGTGLNPQFQILTHRPGLGQQIGLTISDEQNVAIPSGNLSINQNVAVNGGIVRFVTRTFSTLAAPVTSGANIDISGPGAKAFITDANTTTFYSQVSGGGANKVPVFSDGTFWRVG